MTNLADDFLPPADGSERRERSDKMAEKVARRILRDIVARGIKPGTKLPSEALMVERYDVGRASLREGLRILEVYGLIWIKPGPGGGPVVADVNSTDFGRSATFFYQAVRATLRDLVDARVHIEPMMARLASVRLNDETAAMINEALEHEEATLDDPAGLGQARTDRFHNVVMGMSGNPMLGLFSQSIIDIYIERLRPLFPAEMRHQLHKTHREIGVAILKGNATRAERLMRTHVEHIAEQFDRHFAQAANEIIDWR